MKIANLLLLLPTRAYGSVCTGDKTSWNWYGKKAYPPYFTSDGAEKCPQKYSLSSCQLSAAMMDGTSVFPTDDSGAHACTPKVDCRPTKHNCNDTLTCSALVKLKDELMKGGHNIVCRHEKTYWQQYVGEVQGCHVNGNCLDPDVKPTQRQLQPSGWRSANEFAKAFKEMGIPIGKTYSSPFTRCSEHAELFSDEPNEERSELMYFGAWKEVLSLNNITGTPPDAYIWQASLIRNFVGKKPSQGQNNVMVTHGFNMLRSFGTSIDEGYCMIVKPDDSQPSLAESFGSIDVGNWVFKFDDDSFPVDAVARMSPESALFMQTCDDVRSDAIDSDQDDILAVMDGNHDLRITKEEFTAFFGPGGNSEAAFEFIRSVLIKPEVLGKPGDDEEPAIELGQFFHINWGWREILLSGGNIMYPWRTILENTIGPLGLPTSEGRVAAFKQANDLLSVLVKEIKDEEKYPTENEMEQLLVNCDAIDSSIAVTRSIFDENSGPAYIPIGHQADSVDTIFGQPLPHPVTWTPSSDFFQSRLPKVLNCLNLPASDNDAVSDIKSAGNLVSAGIVVTLLSLAASVSTL